MSKFLYENETFRIELIESGAMGYRQILSATNDAAARKNIPAWLNLKNVLDTFINKVVTWEQDYQEDLTIQHLTKVMKKHKIIEEGLTALGLTIDEYYAFLKDHPNQTDYLIRQNLA